MKLYSIYCHIINNKRYIGYTEKTIEARLTEHIKDSKKGSKTYFHRAIKRYGYAEIVTEKLDECTTEEEAKKKEMFYIEHYDTVNNGYNMTIGGAGGNTKSRYSTDQLKAWGINRSKLSAGMNNGNAKPDITKENIIKALSDYINQTNKFGQQISRKEIEAVLKDKLSVSSTMLRNRGIQNFTELVQLVNSELVPNNHIKYNPYYRSPLQKKQLSKQSSNWRWLTNGTNNVRIEVSKLDNFILENKNYHRGRTIKNENN
jgi:group I intron endonuclease